MNLSIKNLEKRFDDKVIFSGLSCDFNSYGIYVISGDSGVGKTTLLRIIAGIDKNYDGEILGGGFERVSVCFQEYRLFDGLSALKNITEVAFKKADECNVTRAKEMLKKLRFTDGEINLKPKELSGGMKQRVAFVRAVMKETPILILDEPTKEVDSEISEIMKEIIAEAAKDRLVLLVTHKNEDLTGLKYSEIKLGTRS